MGGGTQGVARSSAAGVAPRPGMGRTKSIAWSYVWWPGMDVAIEELIGAGEACQSVKSGPPMAPLHPWVWPEKLWQRIHVDFAGLFCGRMFLLLPTQNGLR